MAAAAEEEKSLVDDLIAIVEDVKKIGEFRKTQRKEATNLVRRLKQFLPLLEEIRDVENADIPLAGIACLKKLKKAFRSGKKLLELCNDGSKIYLVRRFFNFLKSLIPNFWFCLCILNECTLNLLSFRFFRVFEFSGVGK